jgi:hypothetical protein
MKKIIIKIMKKRRRIKRKRRYHISDVHVIKCVPRTIRNIFGPLRKKKLYHSLQ